MINSVLVTLIFFTILVDQISKSLAQSYLAFSCNPYFAFSLKAFIYSGKDLNFLTTWFVVFLILSVFYLWIRAENYLNKIGFSFILGGGVSNLLDRIFFGCVRDFIDVWFFPSFNLADSALTLGVLIILVSTAMNISKK